MKIGCTDEDTLDALKLLKKDILKSVEHLCSRALYILHALTEDSIRLVKEKYRHLLLLLAEVTVDLEDSLDSLLALSYPLALDLGNVYGEHIPAGLSGKLERSLRFTCSRSPIKYDIKTLSETHLVESLLNALKVRILKERLKTLNLLLLRSVIEHLLFLDAFTANHILM